MDERDVSLEDALRWMNVYLEVLAADQSALKRMKDLVEGSPRQPEDYDADVQLVAGEVKRVLDRLAVWEALVGHLRATSPT